jgi:hypothetical protein
VHCTGFTFPDIECSFPACLEIAISHWTWKDCDSSKTEGQNDLGV